MIISLDESNLTKEFLAEKIYNLANESFATASPYTKEQFLHSFKYETYLLYMDKEEILGFLSYTKVLDEAEVVNIAVLNQAKSKGIGKQLLHVLYNELKNEQAVLLFLEVRESNEIARVFYEKEGFIKISERKNYYHSPVENAIVMQKKLL
ncbi:ribosomal-protein-alanine N-acetyltransferase [Pilibacter termitis]|uniref:[Ribosomal protein bS18]-alanine N-acetyltransferase n=1 Tax=Pilibacter termitis TaxID=263852 RepID=A0A1T4KPH7_9ENTE|nr:ribosomal protein S18-alanine N-acetyltransferase [Pilibacter termitis]SJZ44294.1 ribosomal-protein-alanine N-acetyltransferase [Pilibacter termitis]